MGVCQIRGHTINRSFRAILPLLSALALLSASAHLRVLCHPPPLRLTSPLRLTCDDGYPLRATAFEAEGGYLGSRLQLALSKRLGSRVTVFAAARADFHQGATNADSPLFRDRTTFAVGIGMVLSLWQSERRAKPEQPFR